MKVRTFALLALVCILLISFASPALAATPAQSAYGGACGSSSSSSSNLCEPSSLPFTGINAGLVVLFGVGMIGAGVAVRRSVLTNNE